MLGWFKKNFDQVEEANWYYESRADEKIYESSVEHIAEQMRLEKKQLLQRKIEELGFREEKDYDGKIVLKNNIPIKKHMAFKEVEQLITRLKPHKQTAQR
jgi:hypothetical protein